MNEILIVPHTKSGWFTTLYSNYYIITSVNVDGGLNEIKGRIDSLIKKMEAYPEKKFKVCKSMRVNDDIVAMFAQAPANCYLPSIWRYELPSGGEFSFWTCFF